jgi:hypothetical protein
VARVPDMLALASRGDAVSPGSARVPMQTARLERSGAKRESSSCRLPAAAGLLFIAYCRAECSASFGRAQKRAEKALWANGRRAQTKESDHNGKWGSKPEFGPDG